MQNPKLTAFIRARLSAGVSREGIRQVLRKNDWSERDVSDAFAAVAPQTAATAAVAAHPLAGRKLSLSFGLIVVSVVYALWQHSGGAGSVASAIPGSHGWAPAGETSPGQSYKAANDALLQTLAQITGSSSAPAAAPAAATPAPTNQAAPAATPAPAPQKPAGQYADGSYTGSSADAYYGTVQVKAVVTNGQLADVQFLQYPNTHSNSVYINSQAMPLLTQEAIQAQSAQIDGVSGATFTSQAFQQSLASALALAKN
ncbi:MAG TPA: FMN-binding protein [Candidatus Paceibacterota bacterium]|nr:FMN-binding protein [Candidatus Paceibacterota bacterium]